MVIGDILVAKITDKQCCRLGERGNGIFLNLRIWWKHTFGKALDHSTWHGEILHV